MALVNAKPETNNIHRSVVLHDNATKKEPNKIPMPAPLQATIKATIKAPTNLDT